MNLRVKTISGNQVKNIKEEKKNCNCSLSSSYNFSGEVLVNGQWHRTSWNSSGQNASGISSWTLENY